MNKKTKIDLQAGGLTLDTAKLSDFAVVTTTKKRDGHVTLYSNSVQLAISPWDIRLMLGQVAEGGVGTANIDLDATIIMSPGHAKAFTESMVKTIEQYESLFGTINNPMDKIQAAAAAIVSNVPKTTEKKQAKK